MKKHCFEPSLKVIVLFHKVTNGLHFRFFELVLNENALVEKTSKMKTKLEKTCYLLISCTTSEKIHEQVRQQAQGERLKTANTLILHFVELSDVSFQHFNENIVANFTHRLQVPPPCVHETKQFVMKILNEGGVDEKKLDIETQFFQVGGSGIA